MDILSGLWSVLHLQPRRTAGLLTAQAEYQARILPDSSGWKPPAAATPGTPPRPCAVPGAPRECRDAPPGSGLRSLRLARVPLSAGAKVPATAHGFRDASTDPVQITNWFGRGFGWNLAIATGAPGPDVLDIDQHGPAGSGFTAFVRLRQAGLVNGAAAYVRTSTGGMHAYFTGTGQHNGHLARHHLAARRRARVAAARSLVTNQVTTPSGNGRRSATCSDTDSRLGLR